jgi:hypothetical protein
MIAFVITAGPAFLLQKQIGENLDNFYVIGSALLIGGIVMWIIDAKFGWSRSKQRGFDAVTATLADQGKLNAPSTMTMGTNSYHQTNNMEEMTLVQACWIGACQILSAVFPGTSRSMSTIAAGQVTGMSRPAALEFSFFLSIPTMATRHAVGTQKSDHSQCRRHRRFFAGANASARLGYPGNRLCCFVHRRLGSRRLVHGLGATARLRLVRRLSHHARRGRALVDIQRCRRPLKIDRRISQNSSNRRLVGAHQRAIGPRWGRRLRERPNRRCRQRRTAS